MVVKDVDLVTLEDGFVYWWPRDYKYTQGCFSAHTLREIANQLDELNREWDQQITDYFNKNKES